ncbi:MAG: hypothetical protein R6U35_03420 [Candidatus Humimicrobiaceae bacterium]
MGKNKKKELNFWEKLAIGIIIILAIIIFIILFNEQIKQYIEIIKAWYESG